MNNKVNQDLTQDVLTIYKNALNSKDYDVNFGYFYEDYIFSPFIGIINLMDGLFQLEMNNPKLSNILNDKDSNYIIDWKFIADTIWQEMENEKTDKKE